MTQERKVNLNISERVSAITILNSFKGALDKLAVILEDIKPLAITEEDWIKADRKIQPTPTKEDPGRTTQTWDNDKGGEKEVSLHDATVDFLRSFIKERDEKGEFTIADKSVITLYDKIK